ncbi:HD-domain/PDEase-like protein [Teratosphaeria nubilosa]|uniref:Phosphodiesterase n=1 Tax=Teratosphaeria nubilosa TaxID=161662 RepID=A0A6G1LCT5_9PEZI|nr:HD-domain/PDEase-like protein [Teratosphaeria nubilosa]
MEEDWEGKCNVVYLVESAQGELCELFYRGSPPKAASQSRHYDASLDQIYGNIRALLDEDQGGFHEVFVSSQTGNCLDRLQTYAASVPTVVLVELSGASSPPIADKNATSLPFLRALCSDINGARYQNHVMPFAILKIDISKNGLHLDATLTATCFSAGALDIVRSPLASEDISRLVSHVKETLRPAARLVGAGMAQNLVNSIGATSPKRIASHRPDESIPEHRRKAVEDAICQWQFPAHEFGMDELTYGALFMLEHMLQVPELEAYSIPRAELMTFLLATRRQYKHQTEVHYHNWRHAIDVTQSVYCFLLDVRICPPLSAEQRTPKQLNAVERLLTPLDGLILLISAIGHDVGHPGVNNAFLIACDHPLAQLYNDKSVLENYHCSAYSQLLRRHWPSLSGIAAFRSTMISTILATDMQRHFEYMGELGKLKQKVEGSGPELESWNDKDKGSARELMMALLMKAADISNVARPFDISAHWAQILMNEFARQGELEAELGIPTCLFGGPPNKEDALAAAQSQKGFMSLFGMPLFSGMVEVMPSVSCAIREIGSNEAIWEEKISLEKQRRESGGESAPLTFSSVTTKEVEEAKLRRNRSEPTAVPREASLPPSTPTKRQALPDYTSPSDGYPAQQMRHHATMGVATSEDTRSSAPVLPAPAVSLSPIGGASRRSSKDVALDQLQQLGAYTHQSLSPNSRRGSADAGWQVQQSYPSSRRGSKDESLTTILVTSASSPRLNSSSSSIKAARSNGSPGKHSGKRHSMSHRQSQPASRASNPSTRSLAPSSATATTGSQTPGISTQPSSLAPNDDDATAPAEQRPSIANTEDPFVMPGHWPNDLDGSGHRTSPSGGLLQTNRLPSEKSDSPRIVAQMASGGSDAGGRSEQRKASQVARESRSRSRLRGLKFWKKRRDVPEFDCGEGGSP